MPVRDHAIRVCAQEHRRFGGCRTGCSPGREEDKINTAENNLQQHNCGDSSGKLFVVGVGPGSPLDRTHRAEAAIISSAVIIGYRSYIEMISDLTQGKEVISSSMLQEVTRCKEALRIADSGKVVSLVSSGDPGIYGMAGLAMEQAAEFGYKVPIEIVSGISAAGCAAARLGAPLMLDYATISLSDLLVSWEQIARRLAAVAQADMVVALYNPRSHRRVRQLEETAQIFLQWRLPSTPVGIATALGLENEQVVVSTLGDFLQEQIGMRSVVIIGNSTTRVINGRMVTPRGYKL
jgi:precorrin-3B C17-methyltransferase